MPTFKILYSAYLALLNAVLFSNVFLLSRINAYFENLFLREFGSTASFSSVSGSMQNSVSLIVFRSIPSEIRKTIVKWISVVVASLISIWTWANESLKNYSVNTNVLLLVPFPKEQERTFEAMVSGWLFYLSRNGRANPPKSGHFVKTSVPNYRQPVFHNTSVCRCGIIS